jgi:hypothetical protein
MWRNLSDETRKRVETAGPCETNKLDNLKPDSDHHELFVEYFADNCDDEEARRKWECYWWLSTKDLRSFNPNPPKPGEYQRFMNIRGGRESKTEVLEKFESSFGPQGATPIAWPSEISGWFPTRDQLEAEQQTLYEAWNPDPNDPYREDDEDDPKWQAWSKAWDKLSEWEDKNPVPMELALKLCRDDVQGWYTAFYDEIARMNQVEMPVRDLDTDYIDSLNEANLKDLTVGQEVKVMAYGTYVLIGQFPPGYEKAVMSYDKAWYGTLTMKEKGGAFSPGKVSVNGCEGQDQEWFKKAFRRVSKKAITFE